MKRETSSKNEFMLFPAETETGWRVLRWVSLFDGSQKERQGVWRRVNDENTGQVIGFQIVAAKAKRFDYDMPSFHSNAAISARETIINTFVHSRTAGMSEDDRMEYAANHRTPEDHAERVQCKVMVYPYVGPKRGDILRVWPKKK